MNREFRLPDVGEGLIEADIVTWRVAVGDTVAVNDVLVEIETAKSLVELPSPYAGTVAELLVAEGVTARVGEVLVRIGDAADQPDAGPDTTSEAGPGAGAGPTGRPSVLVGYGPREDGPAGRRRRRAGLPSAPGPAPGRVAAKPPVRKLARDLGVALDTVRATGPEGLVLRDDVLRHAGATTPSDAQPSDAPPPGTPIPGAPDAHRDPGDVERIPVRGVRRATAAAMTASAFTAPHVTEFLAVDVTPALELVHELRAHPRFSGTRVTFLLLVARALLVAVREFPDVNASFDDAAGEIVRFRRVNLGIAAATPRGLLVPHVADAGALSLPELAQALNDLVTAAREGRTAPREMTGGTITITNVGVFGVDAGTPILNPGEAAILCVGAVRRRPWEHEDAVALRSVVQLALSFDHRLVDGELGSRVLARVGEVLADPRTELLLG